MKVIVLLVFLSALSFAELSPKSSSILSYEEAVTLLEKGLNNYDETEIARAYKALLSYSSSKGELAVKASYVLAYNYYQKHLNNYAKALMLYRQMQDLSEADSKYYIIAQEAYDNLQNYLAKVDAVILSNEYNDGMKAAAMLSSSFLQDYKRAFSIYDEVKTRHPMKIAEVLYAEAYLYLSEDKKVRDVDKAIENLTKIIKLHKDFKLYSDAAFLLAKAKTIKLDSEKSLQEKAKEVLAYLDIAEKVYNEHSKNKIRTVEPEFLVLIKKYKELITKKIR